MGNANRTEKYLEKISPKPMPSELRKKILSTLSQRKKELRVCSPAYKRLFGISCIFIFVALFCDILIQNSERSYLASIMNGPQVSEIKIEKDFKEMTEDLLQIGNYPSFIQWLTYCLKVHRKDGKLRNHQVILDILREEINGV